MTIERSRPDRIGRWAILLAAGASLLAHAGPQDPDVVQAHAERYLRTQTAGLPGRLTIQVRSPRSELPTCAALEAFQSAGSRSVGKLTVGVRCLAPSSWTVYLPAQVQQIASYAVTTQALPANHVLTEADIRLREGDLGSLPADVVTDAGAMVGHRTVAGLAAGAPLRNAVLRPPMVVQQGQTTRLVLNGPGFSVQGEGQALANASRGERVRVKTPSGQVVSGIAEDGQQVTLAF